MYRPDSRITTPRELAKLSRHIVGKEIPLFAGTGTGVPKGVVKMVVSPCPDLFCEMVCECSQWGGGVVYNAFRRDHPFIQCLRRFTLDCLVHSFEPNLRRV